LRSDDVLQLFREKNAIHDGHFLLSSGLHSPKYMQTALLCQYPDTAETLGKALADKVKKFNVECVIAPAVGGLVIGHEIARALGVRFIFTERVDGKMELRRGFEIKPGEKVLVADSVITTGGSPFEVVSVAKAKGADVVGCAVIVDRSNGEFKPNGVPMISLLQINIETFTPANCPMCKDKIPMVKPGSRK